MCAEHITQRYISSPEESEKLERLQSKHNVLFSGYQVFQVKSPFNYIRSVYGDTKICVVKFWSTRLMCYELSREYQSILLRPFFKSTGMKVIIPKTEFVDGEKEGWEKEIVKFVKSDNKPTLVVMEGIVWYEDCKTHYERINRILDIMEQ
jgi:hypothetical protein